MCRLLVRLLTAMVIMVSISYLSCFAQVLPVLSSGYCRNGQGDIVVNGILGEPLKLTNNDVSLVTHPNAYHQTWCEIVGRKFIRCQVKISESSLTFRWSIFHDSIWKNSSTVKLNIEKPCMCYGAITKIRKIKNPTNSVELGLDTSSFKFIKSFLSQKDVSVFSKFSFESEYQLVRTMATIYMLRNPRNNRMGYVRLPPSDFDLICPVDLLLVIKNEMEKCNEIITLFSYNYSSSNDLKESLECSYNYGTKTLNISSLNIYSKYLHGVNLFVDKVLRRQLEANATSSTALHIELEQKVHLQFVYRSECDRIMKSSVTCSVESVETTGIPKAPSNSPATPSNYNIVLFVIIGVGLFLLITLMLGVYCYQLKSRRYGPPADYIDERTLQSESVALTDL